MKKRLYMKIGIIDDDARFSAQLENKIKECTYFQNTEIDIFNEKFEIVNLIEYDYLFIDIMLLQVSGIELAKTIKSKQTKIIFVSANEALVYDCFDIHLYFFIRKAFYKEDFDRLLSKIEKDEAESNKYYLINEKNHQYIRCVDICYIQSHRNICTFYTKDQEYQQYTTLKKCAEHFCSNVAFYKINSYTIINFKYVTKINHQSVTLLNQQTFNISRKATDLIEKYHIYRRYIQ